MLRVLPPSRATNFHVAESKSDIYFLQHENLLREKVVIRATNNPNLQRQHCCTTSCTKMLPVLLGLKSQNKTGVVIGCSISELAGEETTIVLAFFFFFFIVLIGVARLNVIWR